MNIKLSKRLKRIADMLTPGHDTADIGCDHGLVSVYLVQEGIASHVFAMDIGRGPLESAGKNIRKYLSEEEMSKVDLIVSDGFEKLEPGQSQSAIIAGMGGQLIISILQNGLHKSVFGKGYELVLSPQSDVPMVRVFLRENGFKIIDEDMLSEDGKFYNIIKAVFDNTEPKNIESSEGINQKMYDLYGRILLEKKSAVLKDYLIKEVEKKEKLFCSLSRKTTEGSIDRMAGLRNELDILTQALMTINQCIS